MSHYLPELASFSSITLAELKSKAELMQRRDNKYILTTRELKQLLNYCQSSYDLLVIDNKVQFEYRSLYFDSDNLITHAEHNQGKRRRIKVRYRNYADADLHFFEVKLKGFRSQTKKYRISVQPEEVNNGLTPRVKEFMLKTIYQHYGDGWGKPWLEQLAPSIRVDYHRLTLVAKEGAERITIDNRIQYHSASSSAELDPNKWVVEVKSERGRSDTDRFLLSIKKRPVSKCSKYCMGINLLKIPNRNNRFSVLLRRNFQIKECA